jgi:hypothetical protein
MKRTGIALLYAVFGYFITAFAAYWLIMWFSGNTHDRLLEASMTGVFIAGPIGAIIGALIGFASTRKIR